MQRALLIAGVVLLVAALLWPWLKQLPLGRLPGDIVIRRDGFTFFFPITTMILISLVVTLVLSIWRR